MGAPFVWFDLTVADGAKVTGFYQGLFGWDDRGPSARAARRPDGVPCMSELVMVTVC